MQISRVNKLSGMDELFGENYSVLEDIKLLISNSLSDSGYLHIDTPFFEDTELFLRKSGAALNSQLYSFVDPGGKKVSIRPEFTSSVIRNYIERHKDESPQRIQYSGPVFRYDEVDSKTVQLYQAGAELIGLTGIDSDLEITFLAWEGLEKLGLADYELNFNNIGILFGILSSFGLSRLSQSMIMNHLSMLKQGEIDPDQLLLNAQEIRIVHENSASSNNNFSGDEAEKLFMEMMKDTPYSSLGRRTKNQIIDRLIRKVRDMDSPEVFLSAARLMKSMVLLEGPSLEVVNSTKELLKSHDVDFNSLVEFEDFFRKLFDLGIPESNVFLSWGLLRGLAYYTGFTFDIVISSSQKATFCGGGGRYDDLVNALGGEKNTPALGFAYDLNAIFPYIKNKS